MGFPKERPARANFPRPADGAALDITPPGFCWWRAEGAATYRLVIRSDNGHVPYEAEGLTEPAHVPDRAFAPGSYRWQVEAVDEQGRPIDVWGPRSFTIVEGAIEQAWVSADALLERVPAGHPRVLFLRRDLDALRASARTTRRDAVDSLRRKADRLLDLDAPDEPQYDRIEDPTERRMAYTWAFREFRGVINNGMEPLALAYLFTGRREYGEVALRILNAVAAWDPEGVSSILAPHGDEIGLSLVKCGAHAYDWLYDLMTDEERERIRGMLVARADQMLRRLRGGRDFLGYPEESHSGRLPGYLCEHAIALAEEPRARAWLDYALLAYMTVFPHWGGPDGGWAEGIGYGRAYNTILLPPFEAVLAALDLNLWERPFFRKVRYFFFYCSSPVGESTPFGDGGSTGNGRGTATLMLHHAKRFEDPVCRWWAETADPKAARSGSLVNLILPDEIAPRPPDRLPSDAAFRDVGWAALHGNLSELEKDTFVLLKSSPYGSISHSHADQNAICVLKGGRALATSSGYYGPSYGMPHHAKWTRQTKAHCAVLVNGEGQVDRSADAKGEIVAFATGPRIGTATGDATAAYGGRLTRYRRHVLLVRPGLLCILDDLEAPEPATFQWLLHAFEPFELDAAGQRVVSRRDGARMRVRLETPGGFAFSQTDRFDTPYNEGNPPQFREERANHHHFTAATREKTAARRIVAFAVVDGLGEQFEGRRIEPGPGWTGIEVAFPDGTGRIVAQVEIGAASPEGVPAASILQARWTPAHGGDEEIVELA